MTFRISHNGNIIKLSVVTYFLSLSFLYILTLVPSACKASQATDVHVSFTLNQTPLKNVVKMINNQTGYAVFLDENLENIKISGNYNSIKLETFLNRVLKENFIYIISDTDKTIDVHTFASNFTQKALLPTLNNTPRSNDLSNNETTYQTDSRETYIDVYTSDDISPPHTSEEDTLIIDSQTGKPWEEVEEILQQF